MDLTEFYDTFFDEAEELLQNMEQLLLSIDPNAPDRESLDAVFRAAHSIKGGAATFGTFDLLVSTTHKLENVLDQVRTDALKLTPDAVSIFLQGKDVLADQVVAYRGGATPDANLANSFIGMLESFAQGFTTGCEPSEAVLEIPKDPSERLLKVSLINVSDADRDALKAEVEMFGRVVPADGACSWYLTTTAGEADIRAVLGFVVNEDQVKIELHANTASQEQVSPATDCATSVTAHPPSDDAHPSKALASKDTSTIRVPVSRVDLLVNQAGEVVINQSILSQACKKLDPIEHSGLLQDIEHMAAALRTLQESIMALRMVTMDYAFARFPRVVRDTAAKLGKKIDLRTEGGATELDKGLIEKMIDPLTHLIRNSLDHGVESPAVRKSKGKPETGVIRIAAFHEGGRIVIEVADDGAGLNRDKIISKAMERGLSATKTMSDGDAYQLIFAPGFSTADSVTDVSGRGVGMDVVRRNIQEVGGQIQILSEADLGTTFRISLPLTLAIMDGMCLQCGSQRFVMPLNHIAECLRPTADRIKRMDSTHELLHLRGEYLPIVHLAELFDIPKAETDLLNSILMVLQVGSKRYALAVDHLLGQHQVVVKSLETHYRRVKGASGATILGDGSVALILDPSTLMCHSGQMEI